MGDRGQRATPPPTPPLASQLPRVQLLIQRLGGVPGAHPEAWAWTPGCSRDGGGGGVSGAGGAGRGGCPAAAQRKQALRRRE